MLSVKRFEGKPEVYVASGDNVVEVTTDQHLKMANKPLDQILQEVCKQAQAYGTEIFSKYDYPNGEWFPCGTANVVLRWNEHRDIIDLFRKTSNEGKKGRNGFWKGWFGSLMKTESQGWWWTPPMQGTQAMKFQEEVCKFIRDQLIFANIKVDVRTYID